MKSVPLRGNVGLTPVQLLQRTRVAHPTLPRNGTDFIQVDRKLGH